VEFFACFREENQKCPIQAPAGRVLRPAGRPNASVGTTRPCHTACRKGPRSKARKRPHRHRPDVGGGRPPPQPVPAMASVGAGGGTVLRTTQPQLFGSGDACGDWIVVWWGGWFVLQVANTLTSLAYVVAGAQVMRRTETQLAHAYGGVLCWVSLGAVGLHATSTVVGFVGDIVTIAVTMALLLHGALRAGLAARSDPCSRAVQVLLPVCVSFSAVHTVATMLLCGSLHTDVWAVWAALSGAVAIGSMVSSTFIFFDEPLPMSASGIAFALVYVPWLMTVSGASTMGSGVLASHAAAIVSGAVLLVAYVGLVGFWVRRGNLRGPVAANLVAALTSLIFGLGFTVHSWLPGACVGWRVELPLHAVWHLCSALTMNRAGHILDALVTYAEHTGALHGGGDDSYAAGDGGARKAR
jgi:hypothetical protein